MTTPQEVVKPVTEEEALEAVDSLYDRSHYLGDVETLRRFISEAGKDRRDAERWRAYEKRKQAVIDAGMAKNPLREQALAVDNSAPSVSSGNPAEHLKELLWN